MELLQYLMVIAIAWFIVSILVALALGRWLATQDQRALRAQGHQSPFHAERSVPRRSRRARLMQRLVAVTHH